MAQWVEGLAAKPDDLSSIPKAHRVEEKKMISVSFPLNFTYVLWHAHTSVATH